MLCFLALPTDSVGFSTLMGKAPYVQLMFVSITYRKHWVSLNLWVSHDTSSLSLKAFPTPSLGNTILTGTPP